MQTPLRPCPLPSVAPSGTADLPSPARACKCSALSGLRNRPDSFTVGEPPLSPVLPPAALQPFASSGFKCVIPPTPQSCHAGCEAPVTPAPPSCSPSSPDRRAGDVADKPALDGIAAKVPPEPPSRRRCLPASGTLPGVQRSTPSIRLRRKKSAGRCIFMQENIF
jgi:hypothetical protein